MRNLLVALSILIVAACSSDKSSSDATFQDIGYEQIEVHDVDYTKYLTGVLHDSQGAAIVDAILVLCGTINGTDVCRDTKSDTNGHFVFYDFDFGFTYLNIQTYLASVQAGKHYAGVSMNLDYDSLQLDLGTITLPLVNQGTEVDRDLPSDVTAFGLTLVFQPDSINFPDLAETGFVGIQRVQPSECPICEGHDFIAIWALYPFGTFVVPEGAAIVDLNQIESADPEKTSYCLYINATDTGGFDLFECQEQNPDRTLEFYGIQELTWLALAYEE